MSGVPSIANDEEDDDDRQEWFCITCKITQKVQADFNKRERKDLNHLLRIVCRKLRTKLPSSLTARDVPQMPNKGQLETINSTPLSSPLEKHPLMKSVEEPWRGSFLLKQQLTVSDIESKCSSNQYRILDEFRTDVQLLVHNIVIFHGGHSSLADSARQMLRDCIVDLTEILQCRDCFRYANEFREKYWFCKPCRPFHELVYAKQKGFPYWPGKVISSKGSSYEVRFFGGYHQKTTIEKQHIKPITVNIHTLQVKRTSLWNKACEELRKHQELLVKCKEIEGFLRDPFGDPFSGGEISKQLELDTSGQAEEDDEDDEEENVEEEEEESEPESRPSQPTPPIQPSAVSKSSVSAPSTSSKKGRKSKSSKVKKVR